jgi:hypothetical protein
MDFGKKRLLRGRIGRAERLFLYGAWMAGDSAASGRPLVCACQLRPPMLALQRKNHTRSCVCRSMTGCRGWERS